MVNCVDICLPTQHNSIRTVFGQRSFLLSLIPFLCNKEDCMRNILVLFSTLFIITCSSAQNQNDISLIPQPVSLRRLDGSFTLPASPVIESDAAGAKVAEWLSKKIAASTGYHAAVAAHSTAAGAIRLVLTNDKATNKEQYTLKSGADGITITASDPA